MGTDTIAAIATGLTDAGIGIIRISGEEAFSIILKIFKKKNGDDLDLKDSHRVHYGFICDGEEKFDEVLVLVMKGPHSYTAEDTVEIDCHGGVRVMRRILELVIRHGARTAEPGEFTKRAFLNGRIDLSQAEAVIDVISSQNTYALKSSIQQLKGSVQRLIKSIREKVLYEIAYIESALDDPEHISLEGYPDKLYKKVNELSGEIENLLATSENGRIIAEGIKTVIVGKPNVGKSSLLNLLVGEEKAIVTDIAGTTRDVLEEDIKINGISLHIIDTAGIRSTEDIIEKIGVERAVSYLQDADLVIYVVDSSVPLDKNDFDIMKMIKDKKSIVLFNKTDLNSEISLDELKKFLNNNVIIIKTSTKENTGIEDLEKAVQKLFFSGKIDLDSEIMITNLRHKESLEEALDGLKLVKESLKADMPEDFYSIDLMNSYLSLGKIIGEEISDDLMNEIFSKFCMGK